MDERRGAGDTVAHRVRVTASLPREVEVVEILQRLAGEVLQATEAAQVGILRLQGDVLVPVAMTGQPEDEHLLQDVLDMPGIRLEEESRWRTFIHERDPVLARDPRSDPLAPDEWVDAFGDHPVVVYPLIASNRPQGAILVGYEPHHELRPHETEPVRALADAAAISLERALERHELARTVSIQEALLACMSRIGSTDDLHDVSRSITETVSRTFGVSCRMSLLGECTHVVPVGERPHTVHLPIRAEGEMVGYLTVEAWENLGPEDRERIEGFVRQASRVIRHTQIAERAGAESPQREAAHRLTDVLWAAPDLDLALADVNAWVCEEMGFECTGAAFKNPRLGRSVGAETLDEQDRRILSWMTSEEQDLVTLTSGTLASVIPAAGKPAGLLFVRPVGNDEELGTTRRDLIRSIATEIGRIAHRVRLQDITQRAETRSLLQSVRRRLGRHLRATVGTGLEDLTEELSTLAHRCSSEPEIARELEEIRTRVAECLVDVERATDSLPALQVRTHGLPGALRRLAERSTRSTPLTVDFRIEGAPRRLTLEAEEQLYTVVFRTLSMMARAPEADSVVITLRYARTVELIIRGNPVDPNGGTTSSRATDREIREPVEHLGGTVHMEQDDPEEYRLAISLPSPARYNEGWEHAPILTSRVR